MPNSPVVPVAWVFLRAAGASQSPVPRAHAEVSFCCRGRRRMATKTSDRALLPVIVGTGAPGQEPAGGGYDEAAALSLARSAWASICPSSASVSTLSGRSRNWRSLDTVRDLGALTKRVRGKELAALRQRIESSR